MKTSLYCLCVIASLAVLETPVTPAATVTFSNDARISFDNTNYDGFDVVVTNCTVTLDGPHSFASMQVLSGGKLTHSMGVNGQLENRFSVTNETHILTSTNPVELVQSNVDIATIVVHDLPGTVVYSNGVDYVTSVDVNGYVTIQRLDGSAILEGATVGVNYDYLGTPIPTGLSLSVASNLWIAAGGTIMADAIGYAGGSGPGKGWSTGNPTSGGGGGYGGYGGVSSSNAPGGLAYGSILQPADKGSGGGNGYSGPGGAGGGAVLLTVGGTAQVDGRVSANGAGGINERSGGGSGGSIWISAQTLSGSGAMSADGGSGESPQGGGGGGGRIALTATSTTFTGSLSAKGGRGALSGGAGTIYTRLTSSGFGNLLIDNGGRAGTNTLLSSPTPVAMTVQGGAIVSMLTPQTISSLTLNSNGWMVMNIFTLTVLGNAAIASGGGVIADGIGFGAMTGTGAGRTISTTFLIGVGGGYGGQGGLSGSSQTGSPGGIGYGSIVQPSDRGSGGGSPYASAPGGAGGGAISLTVIGTMTVDGRISADGAAAPGQDGGGGSGGSVLLNVGGLAGAGLISANGGVGNDYGGGGGGGRIAIYYQANGFTGTMRAWGAAGSLGSSYAGAGTIYTRASGQFAGQVLVDNHGQVGMNTLLSVQEPIGLTVKGGALVSPLQSSTLGSLLVMSNGWFWLSNTIYPVTVTGDVTVQAGGSYVADGGGYASGSGPAPGRSVYYSPPGGSGFYTGGGAGYGGLGAPSSLGAGGGPTVYASLSSPVWQGSGGGAGSDSYPTNSGGAGGGALRLTVNGTLTVDGRLTADGMAAPSHNAGGGSGGSVWLTVGALSGGGMISASGGAGNGFGGGGGGGRIAVTWTTSTFSGRLRAAGGNSGTNGGGAGTIYTKANSQSTGELVIDNAGNTGMNTELNTASGTINLTIKGGASVTNLYSQSLGNLLIASNSWLWGSSQPWTLMGNATIQSGGGIRADGGGYASGLGQGSGKTSADLHVGGGGGYGGYGGAGGGSPTAYGGVGYGSATTAAMTLGSGGGAGNGNSPTNAGGAGGGTINLRVSGILVVDGRISADGAAGVGQHSGGGAGGGIFLTASWLTGTGVISANGGAGNGLGGGGGGGRIVLQPTSSSFNGNITALGGAGNIRGGAGTVCNQSVGQAVPQVVVDNGSLAGTNTLITDTSVFDLTARNGAVVAPSPSGWALRNLLVGSGGWITSLSQVSQNISVSGTAVIENGGGFSFDGKGSGPGSGQGAGYYSYSNAAGGGGYGGAGGANPVQGGGRTYGYPQMPTDFGSGGASYSGSSFSPFGGAGGGALHLNVLGTLSLDGRISADGGAGDRNSGGGSGGSIWISAGTLIGGGSISANGGAGNGIGGGGGGGRIALTYGSSVFSGSTSAWGGSGAVGGGAGTIYTKANSDQTGQVVIDNAGRSGTNSSLGVGIYSVDLTLKNGAILTVTTFIQVHNLTLVSNSWVQFVNNSSPMQVGGNATIQNSSGITADSIATGGIGVGGSVFYGFGYTGGGGGYGGLGATSGGSAPGGNYYGLVTSPGPGSAGGAGLVVSNVNLGGGLIQLLVSGTLQVDGRISANGGNGAAPGSGGGSGGGISLIVGTLTGNGVISANGGSGNGLGGGGGGGRITINCPANRFAGTIAAAGGGGYAVGGAGTVYTKAGSQAAGQVLVDNFNQSGTNTPVPLTDTLDLIVRGGAVVYPPNGWYVLSNLVIGSGGALTGPRTGTNFDLAVLGSATIDPGGVLMMDGLGFSQSSGPGAGTSMNAIGSGAGYGGVGGASSLQPGGTNYGSAQQPTDRGSGGGLGWGASVGGSAGGGALRLTVGNTLTVNGLVTTDGTAGLQDDSGGGSGGSLWVTAGTIGGSGLISAKGGAGELYQGGGGGGGRIALYYRSLNFGGQLSATGGPGYFSGADGSIFTSTSFSPLAIVSQTPLGVVSNGVSSVDLQFNEPVNPNAASAFSLTTPTGPLPSGSITVSTIGAETLRVSFPLQTTVGDYVFTAGPPLQDLLGQTISQVYTGMFSISLPTITGRVVDTNSQPVAGVLLQPSGAMSPAVTDTNGNYVLGVLVGNDVTVVPALGSLVFVPGARTYTNITTSISQQDYLAVNSLAPTLQTATSGTNFVLSWYAIPGVTYQPYYSTNLVDWLPYSDPLPLTNGATQLLVPLNTDPAQFFRLRAQN